MARSLLNQRGPISGQITQFTLLGLGNETRFEQTMLQEISNPFRIIFIRLASWYRLHMLCIHDQHFKDSFEQVIDGFPKHARGFHR